MTPSFHSTDHAPTNVIGVVVGLPLGALLGVVFLITTVAVVIAVRVQLSRKKEETTAVEYEAVYEVVGPPQLSPAPDPIPTDVNVAYASSSHAHRNAAYVSTNFIDS